MNIGSAPTEFYHETTSLPLMFDNFRDFLLNTYVSFFRDIITRMFLNSMPLFSSERRAVSCSRRISYQETSQTFGVISMRVDVQDNNGRAAPARASASTQAQNVSSSSSTAKMLPNPGSALIEPMFGDEVEVHSMLVLDQHTFEGSTLNNPRRLPSLAYAWRALSRLSIS